MSKFFCKILLHVKPAVRASDTHNLPFLQIQPFSSSSSLLLESIQKSTNPNTFAVAYLINSFGFSPETALSASKILKFETPDKPDSVQAFLNTHGFTKAQIKILIRKYPRVLLSKPEKTILPKFEFLKSKGFSRSDIARLICAVPSILWRSLENRIVPSFHVLANLFQSEVKATTAIKRFGGLLCCNFQADMAPNVKILREAGAPHGNIVMLLTYQPRSFLICTDKFRQIVEEVKKMGFDPLRMNFIIAVQALGQMTKLTWDKKVEVYKKWGLSENEILVAFRKQPWCMTKSVDKINGVMDFIVNEMGWDSTLVAKVPTLMSVSLKRRIVPRCAVYQVLLSRGLVKANDKSLMTSLSYPENWFLEKVVKRHKEEAPELLKLYEEKLDLAN